VLGTQGGLDPSGLQLDLATVGPSQGCRDALDAQLCRRDRIGCQREQLECVGRSEVVEGDQRGREEVAQGVAQPQQMAGAFPDQGLVSAAEHLGGFGVNAVAGDEAQLVAFETHHVGEDVRVAGVALAAGQAMATA